MKNVAVIVLGADLRRKNPSLPSLHNTTQFVDIISISRYIIRISLTKHAVKFFRSVVGGNKLVIGDEIRQSSIVLRVRIQGENFVIYNIYEV